MFNNALLQKLVTARLPLGQSYLFIGKNKLVIIKSLNIFKEKLAISPADFYLIDSDNIKISQVRDLQRFLSLKPHSSNCKIVSIQNSEKLTLEAANALLKTLEEPPQKSIIFLLAENKERLLSTIVSRCYLINDNFMMKNLTREELLNLENEFTKIRTMSIKEKFDYAEDLSQKDNAADILTQWLLFFRSDNNTFSKSINIVKEIQKTQKIITNTNAGKRLLLENLLLLI